MSYKIVGLGEVLWDLLPSGPKMGGAPANFAYHAQALGANAKLITRVGNDRLGHEIIRRVEAMGLESAGIQMDDSAATGTVSVKLSSNVIPEYVIQENVAWDSIEVTAKDLTAMNDADATCFGTLAQRSPTSRKSIMQLLAACRSGCWRILDINLRPPFYTRDVIEGSLHAADVLKLNDEELPVIARMFDLCGEPKQQIESLAETFELAVVALTLGSRGSVLYRQGHWSEQQPKPVNIADTVGAGDAFTAALALGLLHNESLEAVHAFASDVAAYVCSCDGGTPMLPVKFRDHFIRVPIRGSEGLVSSART